MIYVNIISHAKRFWRGWNLVAEIQVYVRDETKSESFQVSSLALVQCTWLTWLHSALLPGDPIYIRCVFV